MKHLIAFITAAVLAAPALADDFPKGSPKFETKYQTALSKAKQDGKPIIVVFSASWCQPCQVMKKKVYPSAKIQPYHEKFIWAYLDVDKDDNGKVAKQYKVDGIPHIQFLNSEGKAVDKVVGESEPAEFAKQLDTVLASVGKKKAA